MSLKIGCEYMIGFLLGIAATMAMFWIAWIAYNQGKKAHKTITKVDEAQLRAQEVLQDHYTNLINYDASVAYKRKVT